MAPRPSCAPTLHGPSSGLSRAPGYGTPPLAVDGAAQATIFTDEELQALMCGECEMLSPSSDDLQAPLFSEEAASFNAPPRFSIDELLPAPLSEDDAELLALMFCAEEIEAIHAAQQPGAPRSNRRAGKKRKRLSPSRRSSSDDAGLQQVHRRPAKKARLLRARHKEIAARMLNRQFRAPEPSRGWTALRCQCAELALAAADGAHCHPPGGCALHQDARSGGEEWMRKVRRRVPIAAGPGKVRVPRLSAGDSVAKVTRYARWRRSVWMPTRFYLERTAERSMAG